MSRAMSRSWEALHLRVAMSDAGTSFFGSADRLGIKIVRVLDDQSLSLDGAA